MSASVLIYIAQSGHTDRNSGLIPDYFRIPYRNRPNNHGYG